MAPGVLRDSFAQKLWRRALRDSFSLKLCRKRFRQFFEEIVRSWVEGSFEMQIFKELFHSLSRKGSERQFLVEIVAGVVSQ